MLQEIIRVVSSTAQRDLFRKNSAELFLSSEAHVVVIQHVSLCFHSEECALVVGQTNQSHSLPNLISTPVNQLIIAWVCIWKESQLLISATVKNTLHHFLLLANIEENIG